MGTCNRLPKIVKPSPLECCYPYLTSHLKRATKATSCSALEKCPKVSKDEREPLQASNNQTAPMVVSGEFHAMFNHSWILAFAMKGVCKISSVTGRHSISNKTQFLGIVLETEALHISSWLDFSLVVPPGLNFSSLLDLPLMKAHLLNNHSQLDTPFVSIRPAPEQ